LRNFHQKKRRGSETSGGELSSGRGALFDLNILVSAMMLPVTFIPQFCVCDAELQFMTTPPLLQSPHKFFYNQITAWVLY
jgi:hypothetical protein